MTNPNPNPALQRYCYATSMSDTSHHLAWTQHAAWKSTTRAKYVHCASLCFSHMHSFAVFLIFKCLCRVLYARNTKKSGKGLNLQTDSVQCSLLLDEKANLQVNGSQGSKSVQTLLPLLKKKKKKNIRKYETNAGWSQTIEQNEATKTRIHIQN